MNLDLTFEKARETFLENLPQELLEIRTIFLQLTSKDVRHLIRYLGIVQDGKEVESELEESIQLIKVRLDKTIKDNFQQGIFVKLGSRSPKDSWIGLREGFKCLTAEKAFTLFCDSERVIDDLYEARAHDYSPVIAVREWIDISKEQEFRCFIINGELRGISQYYYQEYFPQLVKQKGLLESRIREKFERVKPYLPNQNVIMDVVLKGEEVILIEFNPLSDWTDPCLFKWETDTFENFEFRVLIEPLPKPDEDEMISSLLRALDKDRE